MNEPEPIGEAELQAMVYVRASALPKTLFGLGMLLLGVGWAVGTLPCPTLDALQGPRLPQGLCAAIALVLSGEALVAAWMARRVDGHSRDRLHEGLGAEEDFWVLTTGLLALGALIGGTWWWTTT